ncbi:MAG: hypothetical protein RR224_01060 [Clostridia bacterium]
MSIVLYSTDCPKCRVLKQKLNIRAIQYTEHNSVDEMIALGIMQAPMLSVEGELLTFLQANEWINSRPTEEALKQ